MFACNIDNAGVLYRAAAIEVVQRSGDGAIVACVARRPYESVEIDPGDVSGGPMHRVTAGPFVARGSLVGVALAYGDGTSRIVLADPATAQVLDQEDADPKLGDPSVTGLAIGSPGDLAWAAHGLIPSRGGLGGRSRTDLRLHSPLGTSTVRATSLPGALRTAPVACLTGRLRASFTLIPGSQGLGQVYYRLAVRNRGVACAIGKPRIILFGSGSRQLPSRPVADGHGVRIGAGRLVSAQVKFSPDVASTGESMRGTCEPSARRITLSFTGVAGSLGTAVSPPTPVCDKGLLGIAQLS